MKFLIFILLFAFFASSLALSPEQREKLDKLSKHCSEKYGVSEEQANQARIAGTTNDQKVLDYYVCAAKAYGVLNEDGETINFNVLINRAKQVAAEGEDAEKIIRDCTPQKSTLGETLLYSAHCVQEKWPTLSPVD